MQKLFLLYFYKIKYKKTKKAVNYEKPKRKSPQSENAKNDEFYTQLSDIEKELKHYRHHFKDKTVYCNCDDPRISNFFHYFSYNFEKLGLKKLITTCYKSQEINLFSQHNAERAIYLEYSAGGGGVKIILQAKTTLS